MSAKYIHVIKHCKISSLCYDPVYVTIHIMLSNTDREKYCPWTGEISYNEFALVPLKLQIEEALYFQFQGYE